MIAGALSLLGRVWPTAAYHQTQIPQRKGQAAAVPTALFVILPCSLVLSAFWATHRSSPAAVSAHASKIRHCAFRDVLCPAFGNVVCPTQKRRRSRAVIRDRGYGVPQWVYQDIMGITIVLGALRSMRLASLKASDSASL